MKVIHIYARSDLDILPVVRQALPELGEKVALITTIQHIAQLPKAAAILEKEGKQVVLQVRALGCKNQDLEKADTILYIGTGKFHPRGIVLRTGREVITADPTANKVG